MLEKRTARAQAPGNHILWAFVAIAALYFAREVLLPFALAALFTFVVAPIVDRLEKWRLPRIAAVLVVLTTSFLVFTGFALFLLAEINDFASKLPQYEINLTSKVKFLKGSSAVSNFTATYEHMRRDLELDKVEPKSPSEINASTGELAPTTSLNVPTKEDLPERLGAGPQAVPVKIVDSLSPSSLLPSFITQIISPLGTAAVVIIFVIFMLLDREDLRNRLIHLIGSQQLNVTTQAMDDAAKRVGRYLRMQVMINFLFGLVTGIGLQLLGVPNAALWGICGFLLRFIPYIGPVAAAVIPIALALAAFDGWMPAGLVVGLFFIVEMVAGNVLEPKLYGASTNISGFGVMAASVFWMWLWGPVGLILALPLTVCLVVIGSYVPKLGFLNTLLADKSVLPPSSRYYQRLLASDPEEAIEVAEEFLEKNDIEALYDVVIIPALSLAENDRHRNYLSDSTQELIFSTTRELIDETSMSALRDKTDGQAVNVPAVAQEITNVFCLPARDEADELVGLMLAQVLAKKGVNVRVLSVESLASEMVNTVVSDHPAVVCISALPPFAGTHARYLSKRLLAALQNVPIVVGLWQSEGSQKKSTEKLSQLGVSKCVTTLKQAAEYIAPVSKSAIGLQRAV